MQIAVIGGETCSPDEDEAAASVGRIVASGGGILCCGGGGGVMEAAARGAKEKGGMTVGILSGLGGGNPHLDILIRTNLGHARNVVLVQSADAVVAVGGSYGTLSEIAIAIKCGRPVFGYRTWAIEGVTNCATPEEAANAALRACSRSPPYRTRRDA
jgi:uncharacterized protein (TIGR00725 family)